MVTTVSVVKLVLGLGLGVGQVTKITVCNTEQTNYLDLELEHL